MNKNEHFYTNKIILDALIYSCLNFDPNYFKPFLFSEKVKTDMPNKILFFNFFKQMLLNAKENSVGTMSLKIEKPEWENDKTIEYYNLYDNIHKHSRLSILVKEIADEIYLDTMPF